MMEKDFLAGDSYDDSGDSASPVPIPPRTETQTYYGQEWERNRIFADRFALFGYAITVSPMGKPVRYVEGETLPPGYTPTDRSDPRYYEDMVMLPKYKSAARLDYIIATERSASTANMSDEEVAKWDDPNYDPLGGERPSEASIVGGAFARIIEESYMNETSWTREEVDAMLAKKKSEGIFDGPYGDSWAAVYAYFEKYPDAKLGWAEDPAPTEVRRFRSIDIGTPHPQVVYIEKKDLEVGDQIAHPDGGYFLVVDASKPNKLGQAVRLQNFGVKIQHLTRWDKIWNFIKKLWA